MMFINVSKNICYTNYVQSLGLSIQQGWGGWGRDRHMSKSWLSSTILLCSIICTRTYHSCFCNHCPYLATCSAAATIASTIFHLLIIFSEPGAWPKVSYIFLNAHFKKKTVPNPFSPRSQRVKKAVTCWGHLSLFILPFSVWGWTEVLTGWRHSSLCVRPSDWQYPSVPKIGINALSWGMQITLKS